MSTWAELLTVFNFPERQSEAASVLTEALLPLSNADAVKALIALVGLTRTEPERRGITEALVERLDGALAWNLVHMNRQDEVIYSVLNEAILRRASQIDSPHEEAQLLRRGIHADPEFYAPLLIEAARHSPSEDIRELAGYIVWKDTRSSTTKNRADLPWQHLHSELIRILGSGLPIYQESAKSRENASIRDSLEALLPGDELTGTYRIAKLAQGQHAGIMVEYLANWVATQESWKPLMEASKEWAIDYDRRMSLGFFLNFTEKLVEQRPYLEFWKVAPLLKAQIARETRYPLTTQLGWQKGTILSERGKRFEQALAALQRFLPDPALPQPAESAMEAEQLPRPATAEIFSPETLPTPTTGTPNNDPAPGWKRWTKRFKR